MNSEEIYAEGLAIVMMDATAEKNPYLCVYRGEEYRISGMLDSNKPGPNRCIAFKDHPGVRCGYVAKIDEVRRSAELSK